MSIAAHFHSLFLSEDGSVWACGGNESNHLGVGTVSNIFQPLRLAGLPPIQKIFAYTNCSFFIDEENHLWATGDIPDLQFLAKPTRLKAPKSSIVHVWCSTSYLLLTDSDGLAWCMDSQKIQQRRHIAEISEEAMFTLMAPPAQAAFSNTTTVGVIGCDGSVWAVERHITKGNISQNCSLNRADLPKIHKFSCGRSHTLFLDCHGTVWGIGNNALHQIGTGEIYQQSVMRTPEKIPFNVPIVSIACGAFFSLFLDCEGNVWCCGTNEKGQLGLGDVEGRNAPTKIPNLPRIADIYAGSHHSLFVCENGTVLGCGSNCLGQLGFKRVLQSLRDKVTKVQAVPLPQPIRVCFSELPNEHQPKSARTSKSQSVRVDAHSFPNNE